LHTEANVDDSGNITIEVFSRPGLRGRVIVSRFDTATGTTLGFVNNPPTEVGFEVVITDPGDPENVLFASSGQLVDLAETAINSITVVSGTSDDFILISQVGQVNGDLIVDGRNGDDDIVVQSLDVGGQLNIRERAGRDEIEINGVLAGSVFAGLGPSSDELLRLGSSTFLGRASFSGGTGTDAIESFGPGFSATLTPSETGNNIFSQTPIIRSFEE